MSSILVEGLAVNEFHTKFLTAYYLGVQHLESLLTIHLTKEYYAEKEKAMKSFPDFSQTWEGDIAKSVEFIEATGKWFQLLLAVANETELLSFQPKTYEDTEEEIEEVKKPQYKVIPKLKGAK